MIYDHNNEPVLEIEDLLELEELIEHYTDSPIPYEVV